MNTTQAKKDAFWNIRSARYDKLFWTKDQSYIDMIVKAGQLRPEHVALDVGTGTGAIARAIQPFVEHVVAVDTSNSMLGQGQWGGISVVKVDINECFFADGVFDRVFARMVFHHILDNLDRAVLRCFDVLKPGGRIVVAEGVPPSDSPEVVEWYTEMFKHKEIRRTFTPGQLSGCLARNGFCKVKCHTHLMPHFSIRNWLENSGLELAKQRIIMRMHEEAHPTIKRLYNMRFQGGDCIVRTKSVVVVGEK
jgi:ubiquinone/menaquinone biosynthesis C-methylase UbiE